MKDRYEDLNQELKKARRKYENTEIPGELDERIRAALRGEGKASEMKKSNNWARGIVIVAAAVMLCFTTALNTSEAFAAAVSQVPVLGTVSRILTFRTYEEKNQDREIHMEVPKVEESGLEESGKAMAEEVNRQIELSMSQYEADANERIAQYKQAFLDTGGTEEEFAAKNIRVDADYEVKYEENGILSFVITANESWSSAYGVHYEYNLDLNSGKHLTLKDLLGETYVDRANESIRRQMKERMETDANLVYWDGSDGIEGFKTIDESTHFYIGKSGNPVIVFDKYEIAPGAFGRQEFEIAR